jgi:photosystem II reaction center protein PsbP
MPASQETATQTFFILLLMQTTTTIEGVAAYEAIYRRPWGEPWYQFRDVWFARDNWAYLVSCQISPNHFEHAQTDFNLVINSFQLK